MTANTQIQLDPELLFPGMPDYARMWIFALEGRPTDMRSVLKHVRKYIIGWLSHGRTVTATCALLENRFLIVSGHIPGGALSGCSMDALTNTVQQAVESAQCQLISPMRVLYRANDGAIHQVPRAAFRQLIQEQMVTGDTLVFNLGLTMLRELLAGQFERPLAKSCYARLFRVAQPAG